MKFWTFQVIIEKEPGDDRYAAYSPSLPGCFSRGRTVEEARRAIRAALCTRLQELRSRGEPIPANRRFIHVEDVAIGLMEPDAEDVQRESQEQIVREVARGAGRRLRG